MRENKKIQMFPSRFQIYVAVDGGLGCFQVTEGSCQGHPKGEIFPHVGKRFLKLYLEAESPPNPARPWIQEKEANNRQMPWDAQA